MKRFRCVIMRGGTSKGVFFHENEVPEDPEERKEIILRIFGSPDKRQIDGLGGADILTSKVAIVGPPSRKDADADYVFGQVGIAEPEIDFTTICGNLSAAVAPFAVDEGLVEGKEPVTEVKIFCPGVGRYLISEVHVKNGKFVHEGDYRIDGVPGTGSKVVLNFKDTAGLITGRTLPTGNARDVLRVESVGDFEVSIVDAANVAVFVKAGDLRLRGTESPTEIDSDRKLVGTIEKMRMAVAEMINLSGELDSWKRGTSPLLPILAIVQEPMPWVNFVTGSTMKADQADILARMYGGGMMHKAFAVTGAICTGVAARIEGTIINELLSSRGRGQETVIIGHPLGVIPVEVSAKKEQDRIKLERAAVYRTARRIMEGYVYT